MEQLTVATLRKWMDENRPFRLIDVREAWEREQFHIGGDHIPFEDALTQHQDFVASIPVVVYCEKGIRSSLVIQRLEALGVSQLYNLKGGTTAWRQEL